MIFQFVGKNGKYLLVILTSLLLIIVSAFSYYKSKYSEKPLIVIATGEETSESYKLMLGVANIINSEAYNFKVKLVPTRGSVVNARLLQENLVQMATLKADLKIGKNAYVVANLFEETFNLLVRNTVQIENIEEVKGLHIAIPYKSSGESYTYQQLSDHFGLDQNIIKPIISTWKSATWLFENGDVDAIFRVREANNSEIGTFALTHPVYSKSITQAKAITLNYPMYHAAIIPRGAYQGIPPNPKNDVYTLGVTKMLLANSQTPPDVVQTIASILFTRKRELIEFTHVVSAVAIPEQTALLPWHQGLIDFVNKEKPNFFQKNAEFLAFILSLILLAGSSFLQMFNRAKHQRLNAYNEQLLSIKVNVEQCKTTNELEKLNEEHFELVNQIVSDAVQGRISSEGFEFFTFAWNSVTRLISSKREEIKT